MSSDSLTLYKLIILYILDQVDFPLSNAQMTGFILDKGYTNFFTVQQAISELNESELIITKTVRNSTLFRISDLGRETIKLFQNDISEGIKNDILDYLKEKKYELREEVSTLAEIFEAKKGEYMAHCFVTERGSNIVEINLCLPTLEEAEAICSHWKEKSQEIYAYLMKTLM